MRSVCTGAALAVAVISGTLWLLDRAMPGNGYIMACGVTQIIGGLICIFLYSVSAVLAEMAEVQEQGVLDAED